MIIPAPARVKPHVQPDVAKQISPMRTFAPALLTCLIRVHQFSLMLAETVRVATRAMFYCSCSSIYYIYNITIIYHKAKMSMQAV